MHARSKVIERNHEEFSEYKKVLVFGPPQNDDLSYLNIEKVITFDYQVYQSLLPSLEDKLTYSLDPDIATDCDALIINIPKSKAELDLVLAYLTPMLKEQGEIYLVGEKKAGIESAAKKLDDYSDNACKIDSAKHCQLWQASLNRVVERFDIENWFSSFKVDLNGIEMTVATIPGVFCQGELDDATRLLMTNMYKRLEGRVLDFGCGSGVLGCYTKLLNPNIALEMVDINLLALLCAEKTSALNSIEASIYPSNGWRQVKGRVSAVVTNPPFHSGVETEYTTTEGFIKGAKDKMTKHAPFLLVANSFLKYSAVIESAFGRCDVLVETTKFRVYKAFMPLSFR